MAGGNSTTAASPSTTVSAGRGSGVLCAAGWGVAGSLMSGVVTTDNAGGAVGVASSPTGACAGPGAVCRTGGSGRPPGSTIRGSIGWSKVSSSANNDS